MNKTSSLNSHLQNLNPPQLEAVTHYLGPILVLAGAGSGKTRVLTRRIVNLVLQHQVKPHEILAVTFTNKATEEMRERLEQALGYQASDLWVSTFHSTGLKLLRRHANVLGYSNDFVVYDDQDTKNMLKSILKDLNINEKENPVQIFSRSIDQAKNSCVLPADFELSPYTATLEQSVRQLHSKVYTTYQEALRRSNAMDFGDLLMNAVQLFLHNEELRAYYQRKIRFVLVDEYQDTNLVQYMLIRLLTERHNNLLVVGDDDQSIYAFRGATIRNILEFEKDYPNTKVVKLEQNYRSTATILKAAHGIIEKNSTRKVKKLWTSEEDGQLVTAYVDFDELGEADYVATQIQRHLSEGSEAKDIAVFYRTNAQSRALEEALVSLGIPYRIYGGLRFYDRKEIKDIIAYLRLIVNEFDSQAFLRIINTPARGIGPQTVKNVITHSREKNISYVAACLELSLRHKSLTKFTALIESLRSASRRISLSELINQTIEESEYAAHMKASKDPATLSRIENLAELQALARSLEGSAETPFEVVRNFLDRVSLSSSADLPKGDPGAEALADDEKNKDQKKAPPNTVSLMTLHIAKGLEFPVVFLTGFEEGLLPHYRSIMEGDIDEERRLCYVGITRAMKQLYLTRAKRRGMFGNGEGAASGMYRKLSRFASDIPEDCFSEDSTEFFARSSYLDFDDIEDDLEDEGTHSFLEDAATELLKKSSKKKAKAKSSFVLMTGDEMTALKE